MIVLVILSLPLMAQDTVNPPTNWVELFGNINVWLASLAGVAAVTVFLAAVLNKLFKITVGIWKQVVAWGVALVLLVVGNVVNLGFMADMNWWQTLIYGVATGFVANGIFDISVIQAILKALKIEKTE